MAGLFIADQTVVCLYSDGSHVYSDHARAALRLVRAKGVVPKTGPLQTYNQLTG